MAQDSESHEQSKPDAGKDFVRRKFLWLEQVARDADLSGAALRLAILIATQYWSVETGDAWPGQDTLARDLRIDARNVRRAANQLRANGHLEVTIRHGRGISNRYRPRMKSQSVDEENRTTASAFKPDANDRFSDQGKKPDANDRFPDERNRTQNANKPDVNCKETGQKRPVTHEGTPERTMNETRRENTVFASRSGGHAQNEAIPIPANLQPNKRDRQTGAYLGFDDRFFQLLWIKFVAHHRSKGTLSCDWHAEFEKYASIGRSMRDRRDECLEEGMDFTQC